MYTLKSLTFHANYIMDSFVFGICMYTSTLDKTYICLDLYYFDDFHIYEGILLSLIAYSHDYAFHIILVHSHYLMFSHDFTFMCIICAI